ncbi:ATP-binding protein [Streptomyces sp. NPDC058108]|uniref:ATP-binding protein n=1 Tax=Streptomyces sp. NPDC058108 TaxID=3346344 RepID=UPI0036EF69EF
MRDEVPPGEDGDDGDGPARNRGLQTAVALEGDGTDIALARHLAAGFLTRVQAEYGLKVSSDGMDLTRLVVSELDNARKYAPGPVLMELRIDGEVIEVSVWDTDLVLPVARAADPGRLGQHGLEIVMAVAQGFEARRETVGKRITARVPLTDEARYRSPR